jgi:hypothetical protein
MQKKMSLPAGAVLGVAVLAAGAIHDRGQLRIASAGAR